MKASKGRCRVYSQSESESESKQCCATVVGKLCKFHVISFQIWKEDLSVHQTVEISSSHRSSQRRRLKVSFSSEVSFVMDLESAMERIMKLELAGD